MMLSESIKGRVWSFAWWRESDGGPGGFAHLETISVTRNHNLLLSCCSAPAPSLPCFLIMLSLSPENQDIPIPLSCNLLRGEVPIQGKQHVFFCEIKGGEKIPSVRAFVLKISGLCSSQIGHGSDCLITVSSLPFLAILHSISTSFCGVPRP
jgi:hypothetical protein